MLWMLFISSLTPLIIPPTFDRSQDIFGPLLHPPGKHWVWAGKYISEVSEKTLDTDIWQSGDPYCCWGKHWHSGLCAIWAPSALKSMLEPFKKKKKEVPQNFWVFRLLQVVSKQESKPKSHHLQKAFSTFPNLQPAFLCLFKKNNCCHDFSRILDLLYKS